ncbi:long-chain-fatty-acid--CoA ligase [Nocardioides sp. cx-173]|uniref:long-chain-fatty-acid--CoA ligase n=1 Tax=Nocardioides sp. cx-173 TaxID=2898796 RepID=UPI001E332FDE|nr:long-chain-fatty-acid--CoA ligase [Nocardioides sp. cx-173]MCD4524985.1 long-chain-fatty-acid--CoA ligase [Nocardioides sp. cx-173]UGB40307.1 long-chain-fatty-acid--CoA ligase [Nocardioides sp. cx-173]
MPAQEPVWADAYGPGVPLHLEYGDTTVWDLWERSVQAYADRPALDFLGRSSTYAEVDDEVRRVAGGLHRLGVRAGDNVALVMPNCPQNVIAFFAVLRLGATVVEHNPLYTAAELRVPFADHGARVAIVWDKVVPVVEELRAGSALEHVVAVDLTTRLPWAKRLALRLPIAKARESRDQLTSPAPGATPWTELASAPPLDAAHPRPGKDDVALLLYTSGTTGVPKGVPLRHRNLVANVLQGRVWVSGLKEGEESFLVALPLFHAYGVTVSVLLGVALAAKLVLLPKPDVGLIMDAIKRQVPSFVPAVPPLYHRIVDEAERRGVSIRGIRYGLSGAMPLPGSLVERWESATGGLLVEGYGLTETSPVIVGNPMTEARRPGSIGVPFPDVEIRIADAEDLDRDVAQGERGELLVRGPQVFSGYRNAPEETEAAFHDGWFRTGDIVTMAPDGFLTIVDRVKEIIITGGFNVYPSEVEAVIRTHGGVLDVAVVGLPHEDGGEEVVAAVVLVEGVPVLPEELRTHSRGDLTPYKVPRRVVFVDELPTNPMGKVLRREVARLLS